MLKVKAIAGLQWGDEGKGKLVHLISESYDIVARYNGGNNAGHTIVTEGSTHIFHLLPSGMMHPHVTGVIGNGTVIHPGILLQEIEWLKAHNYAIEKRLFLSHRAHIILPSHILWDECNEKSRSHRIGTTKRGIGPTYTDKVSREGMRMGEMLHISSFRSNLKKKLEDQEILLKKLFGITPEWDISTIIEEYSSYAEQLGPYIVDTAVLINKAIRQGKKVLIESAQGTMLDLDFGTYPYVTSCSSLTGGASAGLGIAPGLISQNLGIFKAYTTRVGEGPFPTEVHGPIGKILQESGNEFGSTTGRPRRCGWLDLPALQYAIMLNGIQDLAMMKLDVLDKLDSIKICTEYRKDTVPMENYPSFPEDYDSLEPHFIELEGWNSTTRNCKNFDDLPQKAQQYITSIEKYIGKAIRFISLGPDRKDTIER